MKLVSSSKKRKRRLVIAQERKIGANHLEATKIAIPVRNHCKKNLVERYGMDLQTSRTVFWSFTARFKLEKYVLVEKVESVALDDGPTQPTPDRSTNVDGTIAGASRNRRGTRTGQKNKGL